MRSEFSERLSILRQEKLTGSWKDGWVYGRLKQEFDLQPDELGAIAAALGFKYGWNSMVEDILEKQWQSDEVLWMQQKLTQLKAQTALNQQKASIRKTATLLQTLETSDRSTQDLTEIERLLIALVLKMRADEQAWVLENILNRYRS